jgi:hypothetical protein
MIEKWLNSTWRRSFYVAAFYVVALISMPLKANAMSSGGIIALTNSQRSQNGLSPLASDGRLASSAQAKAQDMLAKGYFAHTAPDGTSPWTFVRNAGYAFITVAENLAQGYGSDSGVVSGWMTSPMHRANMLNGSFQHMGVGIASGTLNGGPTTVIVAHFGATSSVSVQAPAPAPTPVQKPKAQVPQPVAVTPTSQKTTVTTETQTPQGAQTPKGEPKSTVELLLEDLAKIIEPHSPDLITSS